MTKNQKLICPYCRIEITSLNLRDRVEHKNTCLMKNKRLILRK